ncbi:MAG: Mur ligase family protein [Candidatus Thermoplasmatota archaeon]|nr:Mur ligase family protein [Candidatus Thermoplasmatota archaeon]
MDNLAYLGSLGMFRMRPGLSRIRRLLRDLGSPESHVPSVLVGGTNGKGSTCNFLGSILNAMGFSTLVYTSPHLVSPTERFLLDGREISEDVLDGYIGRVRKVAGSITDPEDMPTYFEVLTASAFEMARDRSVDVLISEVGLGGKLDATNVLSPAACAITSISLDHVQVLGEDVRSISREKGGIIKPSTTLVLGPLSGSGEEAMKVTKALVDICAQNGSPVVAVSEEGSHIAVREILEGSLLPDWRVATFDARTGLDGTVGELKVMRPEDPIMGLSIMKLVDELVPGEYHLRGIGRYQMANAAAAACLASIVLPLALGMGSLSEEDMSGISSLVDDDPTPVVREWGIERARANMARGLAHARIRGRFELMRKEDPVIIMDVGHNAEAGSWTAETFREVFPGRKANMLLSMMADKDAISYISNFRGLIGPLTLTVASMERGMKMEDLLASAASLREDFPIHVISDMEKAIFNWISGIKKEEVGLACGTFHLYGALERALRELP